jgi:hypothetical protein
MRDLVPGRDDLLDPLRVALGDARRDEERGSDAVTLQQVQDQRDGDLRAVRALGQDAGLVRVRGVLADPHLLRVEIEREGRSGAHPIRPHPERSAFR